MYLGQLALYSAFRYNRIWFPGSVVSVSKALFRQYPGRRLTDVPRLSCRQFLPRRPLLHSTKPALRHHLLVNLTPESSIVQSAFELCLCRVIVSYLLHGYSGHPPSNAKPESAAYSNVKSIQNTGCGVCDES